MTQIAPERQRVIEGSLHASTPAEREYLKIYIARTGLGELFPAASRKPDCFPHDYEGAILARSEADYPPIQPMPDNLSGAATALDSLPE